MTFKTFRWLYAGTGVARH